MSTLSTHVLDTALGVPAPGVPVTLESSDGVLALASTDLDGRVKDFKLANGQLGIGAYTLTFSVGDYFKHSGRQSLYSNIVIQFHIADASAHYHIPLLLSPFGYSTYRGS